MMKFQIKTVVLRKALNKVGRAIKRKPNLKILAGVLIKMSNTGMTMIGSDADFSIKLKLPAINDTGIKLLSLSKGNSNKLTNSVIINASVLRPIINGMKGEVTTFETKPSFQLSIKSGGSHFTLNTLDPDDYPKLPNVKGNTKVTMSGSDLKRIIRDTSIDATSQSSRPLLKGIHLAAKNGQLDAVATDSHRLGIHKVSDNNSSANYDLTVPSDNLKQLKALIGSNKNVQMSFSGNQVVFNVGNITFYSRLIEGNYPDVSSIISLNLNVNVDINASMLLPAIHQAALVSRDSRNNCVTFDVTDDGSVTVKSDSVTGNSENTVKADSVSGVDKGKDFKINFNADYMIDALKLLRNQDISIKFGSNISPFEIVPQKQISNDNFIQIMTPVRVFR